jgi:hypothetical protein
MEEVAYIKLMHLPMSHLGDKHIPGIVQARTASN